MSILTQSGRAAIAASIKEQSIHLAWRSGDTTWESSHKLEKTYADDQVTLDHQHIKNVKIVHEQTVYKPSVDYIVDSSAGTIRRVKNGAVVADRTITIEYTQDTPSELITSAKLLKEIGRRVIDEVLFCVGDDDGELITPTGRFKASTLPTNNLYLKFTFDFSDAEGQVIRELGVMVGTKIKPDLPSGKRYFEPQDIIDSGILLVLELALPDVQESPVQYRNLCGCPGQKISCTIQCSGGKS